MEVAVGALERVARTLSRYSRHAKAKDEDNEERGDRVKNHMDAEPLWSSGTQITSRQEGDWEGEAHCYAGESSCFWVIIGLLVRFMHK